MKIKPIADENGSYLAKAEEIPTWSLCFLTGFFDFLILPYSSLDSTSEQKKGLTAVSGIADDEQQCFDSKAYFIALSSTMTQTTVNTFRLGSSGNFMVKTQANLQSGLLLKLGTTPPVQKLIGTAVYGYQTVADP